MKFWIPGRLFPRRLNQLEPEFLALGVIGNFGSGFCWFWSSGSFGSFGSPPPPPAVLAFGGGGWGIFFGSCGVFGSWMIFGIFGCWIGVTLGNSCFGIIFAFTSGVLSVIANGSRFTVGTFLGSPFVIS